MHTHTKICPITNCKQTFLKANSHSHSVQCNKVVCIYHRHKRAPGYTIPFEPSWKCQIVLSCRVEVFVSCRLRWKFEMWIFVTRYRLHSNFPPHSWSVMIWEPRLHGSRAAAAAAIAIKQTPSKQRKVPLPSTCISAFNTVIQCRYFGIYPV